MFTWVTCAVLSLAACVQQYARVAPFSGVRFEGDVPHVLVEGQWWTLEAVDEIPAAELVAHAKRAHGSKWAKRIGEDLVQLMSELGKPPGESVSLDLRAEADGAPRRIESAPMTEANRRAVLEANRAAAGEGSAPSPAQISRADARADAAALAEHMQAAYSYYRKPGVDAAAARLAFEEGIDAAPDPMAREHFALLAARFLAAFGDGHTRLAEPPDAYLPRGYLPCLLEDAGGRVVAFAEDRSDFIDPRRPYLVAIDGLPLERWIEVAAGIAAKGAPHAVRRDALRNLRFLSFARRELGLVDAPEVELELEDEKGRSRKKLALALAARKPVYGTWPRAESGRLGPDETIAYLRIESMDDEPEFLAGIEAALAALGECRGLVIDVRDNGGGSRDVTALLVPRLIPAELSPRVVNVAAKRLEPGERPDAQGLLANRRLFPRDAEEHTEADRAAIDRLLETFAPEWAPPQDEFSAWHFLVLRRDAERALDGLPVAVLMNAGCFSATDIFLGALQGLPNVTLVGTPSSGGSGRARGFELPRSRLGAQCSSMVSYRPDGALYDGRGVEPDVLVPPAAEDCIGQGDLQLERALELLAR